MAVGIIVSTMSVRPQIKSASLRSEQGRLCGIESLRRVIGMRHCVLREDRENLVPSQSYSAILVAQPCALLKKKKTLLDPWPRLSDLIRLSS